MNTAAKKLKTSGGVAYYSELHYKKKKDDQEGLDSVKLDAIQDQSKGAQDQRRTKIGVHRGSIESISIVRRIN